MSNRPPIVHVHGLARVCTYRPHTRRARAHAQVTQSHISRPSVRRPDGCPTRSASGTRAGEAACRRTRLSKWRSCLTSAATRCTTFFARGSSGASRSASSAGSRTPSSPSSSHHSKPQTRGKAVDANVEQCATLFYTQQAMPDGRDQQRTTNPDAGHDPSARASRSRVQGTARQVRRDAGPRRVLGHQESHRGVPQPTRRRRRDEPSTSPGHHAPRWYASNAGQGTPARSQPTAWPVGGSRCPES